MTAAAALSARNRRAAASRVKLARARGAPRCRCGAERRKGGHDCNRCHAMAARRRRASVPRAPRPRVVFDVKSHLIGLLSEAS